MERATLDIDMSKKGKLGVATADGDRLDAVLSLGTFESSPARQAAEEACRAGRCFWLLRSRANELRPLRAGARFRLRLLCGGAVVELSST
jgi:hypothetical protein